jgi:hypothetical protein
VPEPSEMARPSNWIDSVASEMTHAGRRWLRFMVWWLLGVRLTGSLANVDWFSVVT